MKAYALVGLALIAMSCFAERKHLTTKISQPNPYTIGRNLLIYVDPEGMIEVTGVGYIEVKNEDNAQLYLEGGVISSGLLEIRGPKSTYVQNSGTADLYGNGLQMDGGNAYLNGGVMNGSVNFRFNTGGSGTLNMGGGFIVGSSVAGDNMIKATMTFSAVDAYAVVGGPDSAAFAITVSNPITQSPGALRISGTPVSGRTYGLVDGVADDTFHTKLTPTVPAGWKLVRYGRKLLLVETSSLEIVTATWTGQAGDGNPQTPGNWDCRNASNQIVAGALPGVNTSVYLPADTEGFNFAKNRMLFVKDLCFLGETYTLDADTDWSGLSSEIVVKYPTVVDVNGHKLTMSEEPMSTAQLPDLTVPGGNVSVSMLGSSVLASGSAANLVDGVATDGSRFLVGPNFAGCNIDYDFGEGEGKVVRGIRFHTNTRSGYTSQRRPKELFVYGTTADPAQAAAEDWRLLASYTDLNLKQSGWTNYLVVDNETPYRAYRIAITKNVSSDSVGTYLELFEMELASLVPKAAEVTSGVAGGELHFDVPEGKIAQNVNAVISGSIKVVKEGAGTLAFGKTDQTFTGGVEGVAGQIRMDRAPSQWPFGGAPNAVDHAMSLTLHEGVQLDVNSQKGWGYTDIFMDGGMILGQTTQLNPQFYFTAPSAVQATGDITLSPGARMEDLGGQTLTIDVNTNGRIFSLNQGVMSNGVLNVVAGGWFANNVALDARTVDLKMNAALNLSAPLAVHDYDAKFNSYYNQGTAALDVYGTFTPHTDYFYGCTLQNGAMIDLSEKTNEWVTTSLSNERATVDFADDAAVAICLGSRRPVPGDRLVYWTEPPVNLSTLSFSVVYDDPEFSGEPLIVSSTGIFYGVDPGIVDRAYWTGAANDDNLANPANWACTNVINQGVVDGLPNAESTICLGGRRALDIPAESDFAYKRVVFTETLILTADCDWRGLNLNLVSPGAVIDLDGHKLTVSGFAGTMTSMITITDSSTGEPGEFHVDVPFGAYCTIPTIQLDGNLRLVTEGAGTAHFDRAHQTYTGGTVIASGSLRLETNPNEWPLGCDGMTAPDAMKVYIRPGGQLYVGAKEHWEYVTVYLEGGKIGNWSNSFNPKIVVCNDSAIDVFNGSLDFGTDAFSSDLGGRTLSISIASGKYFSLHQTNLSNGVLDVVSGGWFGNFKPLDARTVDLKMNAVMQLDAELSVHDYDAKFNRDANAGMVPLNVYGTFTPRTVYFYGCTLHDGATIDLAGKTEAWSTTSAFTSGLKTVTFETGAQIKVKLGDRAFKQHEKIISWTPETRPSNLASLKFVNSARGTRLTVDEDGVYWPLSFTVFVR